MLKEICIYCDEETKFPVGHCYLQHVASHLLTSHKKHLFQKFKEVWDFIVGPKFEKLKLDSIADMVKMLTKKDEKDAFDMDCIRYMEENSDRFLPAVFFVVPREKMVATDKISKPRRQRKPQQLKTPPIPTKRPSSSPILEKFLSTKRPSTSPILENFLSNHPKMLSDISDTSSVSSSICDLNDAVAAMAPQNCVDNIISLPASATSSSPTICGVTEDSTPSKKLSTPTTTPHLHTTPTYFPTEVGNNFLLNSTVKYVDMLQKPAFCMICFKVVYNNCFVFSCSVGHVICEDCAYCELCEEKTTFYKAVSSIRQVCVKCHKLIERGTDILQLRCWLPHQLHVDCLACNFCTNP